VGREAPLLPSELVAALPDDLARAKSQRSTPPAELAATEHSRSAGSVARAYFLLTKPRVIELLLVTTVPSMILAEEGLPALWLIGVVLLGGAMAAGGANTINCWIERDRDRLMRRTHGRPLPQGDVNPTGALVFGLVLEVLAFALLWSTVNLLAATLAVSATVFYVFVYTLWLKPRTVHNIVIGGAAGAVPALVGWAAVRNGLGAPAWLLFAIVFFWTPAHFWALAMKYREDYERAGIPMLPVRHSPREAATQITVYAALTTIVTLLLGLTTTVGVLYVGAAAVLGTLFVSRAVRLVQDPALARAIEFFTWSNVYLMLVFVAVAADTLLR